MAQYVAYDTDLRVIYVTSAPVNGETTLDVQVDLYSDIKEDWKDNAALNKFKIPISSVGGQATPKGTLGDTYFLNYGWKIRPYEADHKLSIVGNLFTSDGSPTVIKTIGNYNVLVENFVSNLSDSTVVQLDEITNQSYLNAQVFINTEGVGSATGIGTPVDPIDNFAGAYLIAAEKNLSGYNVNGALALGNTDVLSNAIWEGNSLVRSSIVFTSVNIDKTKFKNFTLSGSINSGRSEFLDCALNNVSGFNGGAYNCGISGTTTLDAGATMAIVFRNGYSLEAGAVKPKINCNGVTADINIREQVGGLEVEDFNGGGDMSIDAGGVLRLKIASSCTAGTIVVGGVTEIDDQSGPGCTVIVTSTVQDLVWNKTLP